MKTIAIGCSLKYEDLIREVMTGLSQLGLNPGFPNLDTTKEGLDTPEEKKRLALEHYQVINDADSVYFLTPEGYMGTSCKIELGYAIALGKPVYFSEPTGDPALDCYVVKFVKTDSLGEFLN